MAFSRGPCVAKVLEALKEAKVANKKLLTVPKIEDGQFPYVVVEGMTRAYGLVLRSVSIETEVQGVIQKITRKTYKIRGIQRGFADVAQVLQV